MHQACGGKDIRLVHIIDDDNNHANKRRYNIHFEDFVEEIEDSDLELAFGGSRTANESKKVFISFLSRICIYII